uniref:ThuA domain-containing protein n=1 Tax=Roseihalotalea indica TaxID=2867963 RepID=A0AA49GNC4_9BACT|nr:ThuA domain-containing protein [Tunicatimonas sp. TK19036]
MLHAGKSAFSLFIFALVFSLTGVFNILYAYSQLPEINISVAAGKHQRINTPVFASLDHVPLHSEEYDLQLVETTGGKETPLSSQLNAGSHPQLHWILTGKTQPGTTRSFALKFIPKREEVSNSTVTSEDTGEEIQLKVSDKEVLAYRYTLAPVPEDVSHLYSRAGYIHPLRSPKGGVVTRIQPPDHYHHYGIWNPWTKTEFEGEEIDFWNIGSGQATVQVKGKPEVIQGDVYGEVSAKHEHVVLNQENPDNSKVALNEDWDIRVWNTGPEADLFLVDVTSTMRCATSSPFTIKEYRYEGFGFRANEQWNDATASLVTSEGYDKSDGNGTRARWCDISGPTQAGTAGVLFMTSPANYNYPEKIRIWPTGMNDGEENVFFNFNPTQDRDWTLKPGNEYALKYRMMVYDGKIDQAEAERYWNDFANPPQVEVQVTPSLEGKKILVYTKNGEGYVHDNIAASVKAIKKLGKENGFEVVSSDDPSLFTDDNLEQYDVLVFSNTNNKVFDTEAQKKAFQNYIQNGGGFVGIHSAVGSERDWPWFAQMIGGRFLRHPQRQDFEVKVLDKNNPSTSFLPDVWQIKEDECYYVTHMNPENHVLLAADLTTVEDDRRDEYPANTFGDLFPLSWYHEFDGGRQWYSALGHRIEHYSNPEFMRHILGGIRWAAGEEKPMNE